MKKMIIALFFLPVTGFAEHFDFNTETVTYQGAGTPDKKQQTVNLYYIENVNTAKQLNQTLANIDLLKYNFVFIGAGFSYHTPPDDVNKWLVDSENDIGKKDQPIIINGNGYSEYSPNDFYTSPNELYDITDHVFFKLGIGEYNNLIINDAAVSTGNTVFPSNANTKMPKIISDITLNNSFFYLNQLGNYGNLTANGHSTVAVVGTYFSYFYSHIPQYDFTQYIGNEYGMMYSCAEPDKDNQLSVVLKNATYNDTSKEILRGDNGRFYIIDGKQHRKTVKYKLLAESLNSIFKDNTSQRIMNMGIAHSSSFYDNARLTVEHGGKSIDTTLNNNSTAIINSGAILEGKTQLNDDAQIMFAVDGQYPVQIDNLHMNSANNLATVLEAPRDGGLVNINNLVMKDSRFKFQRPRHASGYATLNISTLSGSGQFVINTDLSKGKGDFISVGHGTGNYHLVVADTGKEISGTAENLNLVLNKQGDAAFSLTNASGVNVPGIDGGTYTYTLQHKKNRDGEYWYLNTKGEG
ncbi:TPA: hypothetical protein J1413_004949, partial [Escherichia coli]|nr:hypothetical protein [Escherichia coli]HBA9523090.1 hypothetical protein [Escherichia coli]HBA9551044.1 hypothetical protein [Escherichia coli]HBA9560508.1 hypothetical protein [Escherichia coli]